jgi:putative ABC transport system permease protein
MTRLFGIPMGDLEVVLVGLLVAALVTVSLLALRNRIFFRLGVRNVRRRPGRSALIIVGLMLGTAIIAATLATGDTMARTVRSATITSLGQTDELIAAKGAAPA